MDRKDDRGREVRVGALGRGDGCLAGGGRSTGEMGNGAAGNGWIGNGGMMCRTEERAPDSWNGNGRPMGLSPRGMDGEGSGAEAVIRMTESPAQGVREIPW